MDDAAGLLLRIRVIAVSTRAAVNSLGPEDPQMPGVVARGQSLLEGIAPLAAQHESEGVRRAFDQARRELASLDGTQPARDAPDEADG